ncbi:hypothetical protein AVEN_213846-1 [Araneus ventricosus]|uniref:HAT C-terminal dimerisation domain-containing protein n=1 Tax=Araneus ventricosus TaxID=182803 RepID=A0A4Y2K119_ARAVE|nr:hypothetical protein AVEN_213846-1 [Araneus ventricosus]
MQKVNEMFGFLSPKQLTTLDNKTLREKATTLANLYRDDLDKDELSVEIESFKYSVIGSDNLAGSESKKSKLNSTALDFLNYLYTTGLHENYSNLTTALRIYLTLPVSVASNERSFSKLKIIKNYLRNLTKQDRLSNLAVIYIEHEKASKISYDDVIKTFAAKKRKIKLK